MQVDPIANLAAREKFCSQAEEFIAQILRGECTHDFERAMTPSPMQPHVRTIVRCLLYSEIDVMRAEKLFTQAVEKLQEVNQGTKHVHKVQREEDIDVVTASAAEVDPFSARDVRALGRAWQGTTQFYKDWDALYSSVCEAYSKRNLRRLLQAGTRFLRHVTVDTPATDVLIDCTALLSSEQKAEATRDDVVELANRLLEHQDELLGDHRVAAEYVLRTPKFDDSAIATALRALQLAEDRCGYLHELLTGVARKSLSPFAVAVVDRLREYLRKAALEENGEDFLAVEISETCIALCEVNRRTTCFLCPGECKTPNLPLCKWSLVHHAEGEECKCKRSCNDPLCVEQGCYKDHLNESADLVQGDGVKEEEIDKAPVAHAAQAAEAKEAEMEEEKEASDSEATDSEPECGDVRKSPVIDLTEEERPAKKQKMDAPPQRIAGKMGQTAVSYCVADPVSLARLMARPQ